MAAAIYDFVPNKLGKPFIEQGADFVVPLTYKDSLGQIIGLVGYTASLQIRDSYGDPAVLLELNTTNGRIIIDGPNGKLTLKLTGEETQAIDWESGVYDLLLTDPSDGEDTRLMQGIFVISAGVTAND